MSCASCGRANPEDARFCAFCGTPLAPSQLAAGERKYATVLFADVAGSTALSERLDPEDWAEIMNGAFAFMNASVTAYGGTVGRLMGDAILAFFGAPDALEGHAVRAAHAALAMQTAATEYADTLLAQYGIEFRLRVGIATGLVVYASVGDGAKAEYTAMGDTANVAARLQGLAEPGTVLVDGESEILLRRAFHLERLDATPLRGKAESVDIYRIVRQRAHPDAVDVTAPLVGRGDEVDDLVARIRAGARGSGSVVLVVGEAGVGKSRLLAEVRDRATSDGALVPWIEGRALSFGQASTYHAWRSAIRSLLGLDETAAGPDASAEEERRLVAAALRTWAMDAVHQPLLEHVAGIEPEELVAAPKRVADEGRAEAVAAAVRALLHAAAIATPFVLSLEDLHWADGASVDLLVSVADVVRSTPLTVVVAMRPERSAPAWRVKARLPSVLGEAFTELHVSPLDGPQAHALLAQLPAAAALPESMRTRIVRKSDGNPYFLEEIVRDLIDSGRLVHDGSRWHATDDVEAVDIPDTLLGVLTSRIDRLPKDTKHVAQTAAVIGRTFASPVLTGIYASAPPGERVDDLEPHLATLTREELVRELDTQTRGTYRFKHALSQEAAYASLLLRRRRELHVRTLDVLEGIYGEGRHGHAAELAFHALRAESWSRAATWSDAAGHRSMRVYAVNEALEHFTNAIESLERLDEPDPERVVRTTIVWIDVSVRALRHEQLGPRQAILERADRAEALARGLGHKDLLARVLVHKGNVLVLSGFPETAYPFLEEASDIAIDLEHEPLLLLPFFITTERMVDQDPRRAAAQLQDIITLSEQHGNRGLEAHAHAVRALALARLGEYDEARAEIETALAMGAASGSRIKQADVNIVAGMVYLELGERDRAVALSELGARQALDMGGAECACAGYYAHGMSQLMVDRLPEASESFRTSAELGANVSMKSWVNLAEAGEAYTRLKEGDLTAVAQLEGSLANAKALRDAYGTAQLQRLLGEHYLARSEYTRAAELYREAIAYYDAAGMTPDLIRIAPTAADALERAGDVGEASALRRRVAPDRLQRRA